MTFIFWGTLLAVPLVFADGIVDPELVGRWKLPNQAMYWDIHADGTYTVSTSKDVVHSGTFTASYGTWSLQSETWGEDGGTYEMHDHDTFLGTGRLGPAIWKRVHARQNSMAAGGAVALVTQLDSGQALPKDIPELVQAALQQASAWQPDAVPVAVDFKQIDAPNMKGPEVRLSFVSPFQNMWLQITVTQGGTQMHEFVPTLAEEAVPLPSVFVDLPAAVNIARKNGMKGALKKAGLRVWSPAGAPPVLAWMLWPNSTAGGKTVNAAAGEIIDFDVTGYIDSYNAQWDKAARGLRALTSRVKPYGAGPDWVPPVNPSDPAQPVDHGEAARAEYERNAAEGRAYWGGSAEDYNRIKNGGCTWNDSSNYGC